MRKFTKLALWPLAALLVPMAAAAETGGGRRLELGLRARRRPRDRPRRPRLRHRPGPHGRQHHRRHRAQPGRRGQHVHELHPRHGADRVDRDLRPRDRLHAPGQDPVARAAAFRRAVRRRSPGGPSRSEIVVACRISIRCMRPMAPPRELAPDPEADAHASTIRREGFVVLRDVLSPAEVAAMRAALAPWLQGRLMGRNDFEGFCTRARLRAARQGSRARPAGRASAPARDRGPAARAALPALGVPRDPGASGRDAAGLALRRRRLPRAAPASDARRLRDLGARRVHGGERRHAADPAQPSLGRRRARRRRARDAVSICMPAGSVVVFAGTLVPPRRREPRRRLHASVSPRSTASPGCASSRTWRSPSRPQPRAGSPRACRSCSATASPSPASWDTSTASTRSG